MDRELSRIKEWEIAIEIANKDLSRGVHSKRGSIDSIAVERYQEANEIA